MYKYLKRIADFVIVLVALVVLCDFSVYNRRNKIIYKLKCQRNKNYSVGTT